MGVIASAVSLAKSPAASFIALFAGIIGWHLLNEPIKGMFATLLAFGGAGALVHGIDWCSRQLNRAVKNGLREWRYRRAIRRACEKQLYLFKSCLRENKQSYPTNNDPFAQKLKFQCSDKWLQDLLENELIFHYPGCSGRGEFIFIIDDFWRWLGKNRSFVERRAERKNEATSTTTKVN